MPELPEVEVVRAGLERHVLGHVIDSVEVLHPRPLRRDPRGSTGFAAALVGQRIDAVRRRGKYFWLALAPASSQETGDAMLGHLGMSGQMLLTEPGAPDERHLRVRFGLSPSLEMRFVDQRMFGGLLVSTGGAELPTEIVHIARDPIDPDFDDDEFVRRTRRRTSAIKRLLLDQGLISGVGNIYADEALWRARLHPLRAADTLTAEEVRGLHRAVRAVLRQGIENRGASFADYVGADGEPGDNAERLAVYRRTGEPCLRCGRPISRIVVGQRSTHFCPHCQRLPEREGAG